MAAKSPDSTSETTMAGAALYSTIAQIQDLGSIGTDILTRFGVKEISFGKRYSYKIRGAIHTELYRRYGDETCCHC